MQRLMPLGRLGLRCSGCSRGQCLGGQSAATGESARDSDDLLGRLVMLTDEQLPVGCRSGPGPLLELLGLCRLSLATSWLWLAELPI